LDGGSPHLELSTYTVQKNRTPCVPVSQREFEPIIPVFTPTVPRDKMNFLQSFKLQATWPTDWLRTRKITCGDTKWQQTEGAA